MLARIISKVSKMKRILLIIAIAILAACGQLPSDPGNPTDPSPPTTDPNNPESPENPTNPESPDGPGDPDNPEPPDDPSDPTEPDSGEIVPPSNVLATPGKGYIGLTWTRNTEDSDVEYVVYRKRAEEADFARMFTAPAEFSAYVDNEVVLEQQYLYGVAVEKREEASEIVQQSNAPVSSQSPQDEDIDPDELFEKWTCVRTKNSTRSRSQIRNRVEVTYYAQEMLEAYIQDPETDEEFQSKALETKNYLNENNYVAFIIAAAAGYKQQLDLSKDAESIYLSVASATQEKVTPIAKSPTLNVKSIGPIDTKDEASAPIYGIVVFEQPGSSISVPAILAIDAELAEVDDDTYEPVKYFDWPVQCSFGPGGADPAERFGEKPEGGFELSPFTLLRLIFILL